MPPHHLTQPHISEGFALNPSPPRKIFNRGDLDIPKNGHGLATVWDLPIYSIMLARLVDVVRQGLASSDSLI